MHAAKLSTYGHVHGEAPHTAGLSNEKTVAKLGRSQNCIQRYTKDRECCKENNGRLLKKVIQKRAESLDLAGFRSNHSGGDLHVV